MGKLVQKLFLAHFFRCPYRSNSSKTSLDVALVTTPSLNHCINLLLYECLPTCRKSNSHLLDKSISRKLESDYFVTVWLLRG